MKHIALCLLLTGCAGTPLQQDFLTQASHFLSSAQDIEQRALKVYNAVCAGREDNVDCVFIRQKIEAGLGITLTTMADGFEQMNATAKEAQK